MATRTEKITVALDLKDELTRGLSGISRKMRSFGVGAAESIGPLIAAFATVKAATAGLDLALGKVRGAIDFEAGLIGVGKTSGIAGEELQKLGQAIRGVSLRVPVATGELLEIGQAAGQLGVTGAANIAKFTETVAKLGGASDLQGDEAATTLARLLTVTKEPTGNVDRLASALVALGNSTAATEREIANTAQSVAQAASTFNLTSADAAGFGAALAAVGVNAELAGSSVGRLLRSIDGAVRDGGDNLEELASIAGTTSEAFGDLFAQDRVGATTAFLAGLDRLKEAGGDVTSTLERLGLSGEENLRVIPTLAGNIDLLNRSLETSRTGFAENIALTQESDAAAEGLGKKITLLMNAVESATAIGQGTLDVLKRVVDFTRDVVLRLAGLDGGLNKIGDGAWAYADYLKTALRTLRDVASGIGRILRQIPGLDLLEQAARAYAGFIVQLFDGSLVQVRGFSARAGDFMRATVELAVDVTRQGVEAIAKQLRKFYVVLTTILNVIGSGVTAGFNAIAGPVAVALDVLLVGMLTAFRRFASTAVGIFSGVTAVIRSAVESLAKAVTTVAEAAVIAGRIGQNIARNDFGGAALQGVLLTKKLDEIKGQALGGGVDAGVAFGRGFKQGADATSAAIDIGPTLVKNVLARFDPIKAAKIVLDDLNLAFDLVVDEIGRRAEGFRIAREQQDAIKQRISDFIVDAKNVAVAGVQQLVADVEAAAASLGFIDFIAGFKRQAKAQSEASKVTQAQTSAEADLNAALQKRKTTVAELSDLVRTGALTQDEAADATVKAFDAYEEAVKKVRDRLIQLAETTDDPRLRANLLSKAAKIEAELEEEPEVEDPNGPKSFAEIGTDVRESSEELAASGLTDAFTAIAEGSKTAAQAFGDFARQFAVDVARMIAQALLLKAIKSAVGGIGGLLFNSGGEVPDAEANTGGLIDASGKRSPQGQSRDPLVRLTPGEAVLPPAATASLGGELLQSANRADEPSGLAKLARLLRGKPKRPGQPGVTAGSTLFVPDDSGPNSDRVQSRVKAGSFVIRRNASRVLGPVSALLGSGRLAEASQALDARLASTGKAVRTRINDVARQARPAAERFRDVGRQIIAPDALGGVAAAMSSGRLYGPPVLPQPAFNVGGVVGQAPASFGDAVAESTAQQQRTAARQGAGVADPPSMRRERVPEVVMVDRSDIVSRTDNDRLRRELMQRMKGRQ